MATNDRASDSEFNFESPDQSNSSSGWINLDAGDQVAGEITAYRPYADDYGVIEIDGRPFSLNKTQRDTLIEQLVIGEMTALRCLEEEESFENGDGETITYNPTEIGFQK